MFSVNENFFRTFPFHLKKLALLFNFLSFRKIKKSCYILAFMVELYRFWCHIYYLTVFSRVYGCSSMAILCSKTNFCWQIIYLDFLIENWMTRGLSNAFGPFSNWSLPFPFPSWILLYVVQKPCQLFTFRCERNTSQSRTYKIYTGLASLLLSILYYIIHKFIIKSLYI